MPRFHLIVPVQVTGCALAAGVGLAASGYSYYTNNYAEALAFILATVIAPSVIWLLGSIARSLHQQSLANRPGLQSAVAETESLDEDTLSSTRRTSVKPDHNVYSAPRNAQ